MAIKGVKSSETYVTEQKAPKIRKKCRFVSKNFLQGPSKFGRIVELAELTFNPVRVPA